MAGGRGGGRQEEQGETVLRLDDETGATAGEVPGTTNITADRQGCGETRLTSPLCWSHWSALGL